MGARVRAGRPWHRLGALALAAGLATVTATACTTSGEPNAAGPTAATTTAPSTTADTRATATTASPTTTTVVPTTGPAPASTSTTAPATTTSAPASAAATVDRLVVRDDADGGAPPYRRDAFGDGWSYDPTTGCNTRELVLIDESLVPATIGERCHPTSGTWRSSYDDLTTHDPADLQIDHVVALADAWRSGAWTWTAAEREAFANDRTMPETLAAVSGHSNQSKGDAAPDEWLPEVRAQWCPYATAWVAIKARWKLSVTGSEKAALVQVLSGC